MLIKTPVSVAHLVALSLSLVTWTIHAFDLQAHRGGRGLAPENTLSAFENALNIGVTTLELDVGLTSDGVVVISHDPYLNPALTRDAQGQWLSPGKGPLIKDLTLGELRRYDVGRIQPASAYAKTFDQQQPRDGERVPTLAALFDLVKSKGASEVRFNIETKLFPLRPHETAPPEVLTRALLSVIEQSGMSKRVSIQSFDWRSLQLVQKWAKDIPTVYLTTQSAANNNLMDGLWTTGLTLAQFESPAHMVKAAGGKIWSPNFSNLTETSLAQARLLGLQVIPWTVNAEMDLKKMMDWQVDGIITDYPNRLRNLMHERGLPLPKGLKN